MAIETRPVLVPVVVGANTTLKVVLDRAAILVDRLSVITVKSPVFPERTMGGAPVRQRTSAPQLVMAKTFVTARLAGMAFPKSVASSGVGVPFPLGIRVPLP